MSSVRDENDLVSGDAMTNLDNVDAASAEYEHADQGCEVVLDKSHDPDGKLFEILTRRGFRKVEDLDDFTVVLAVHMDEEISIESVRVDAEAASPSEDNSKSDFRGAVKVPEVEFKWSKEDICVSFSKEYRFSVDNRVQEVFGDFYFKTADGREGDSRWARLALIEYSFGVKNGFNDDDKRGLFVYKVTTAATPSGTWHLNCDKLIPLPTPKASEFTRELGSTVGIGSSFSATNPVNITAQKHAKRGVTSREFVWKPCSFTGRPTRSVTWTWEMFSWEAGKEFNLDKPSRFALGGLPKLPSCYDPEGFSQSAEDFVADARWRIPNMSDEDLGNVKWEIVIQVHLAFVEKGWNVGPLRFCPKPVKKMFEIKSSVTLAAS